MHRLSSIESSVKKSKSWSIISQPSLHTRKLLPRKIKNLRERLLRRSSLSSLRSSKAPFRALWTIHRVCSIVRQLKTNLAWRYSRFKIKYTSSLNRFWGYIRSAAGISEPWLSTRMMKVALSLSLLLQIFELTTLELLSKASSKLRRWQARSSRQYQARMPWWPLYKFTKPSRF